MHEWKNNFILKQLRVNYFRFDQRRLHSRGLLLKQCVCVLKRTVGKFTFLGFLVYVPTNIQVFVIRFSLKLIPGWTIDYNHKFQYNNDYNVKKVCAVCNRTYIALKFKIQHLGARTNIFKNFTKQSKFT